LDKNASLYQDLLTIRQFESQLIEKFSTGVFPGTTHTCLGQEANAVGVIQHLHDEDIVVSNHRGHGHFLAYGGDPKALFAELMGKTSGVSGGLGGSQHLHWRNFYSSGIQGGTLAMATGMALAENHKGSPAIVVDFMGDGTLGEGIVYECLNMISLWQLPILIVLENNHIAQTTPSDLVIAGDVAKRFEAFDLVTSHIDSSDVLKILPLAGELISQVRVARSPRVLIIDTARLGTHSKGDDTRSPEHLEELWRTRDPVAIQGKRLGEAERIVIESLVSQRIDTAYLAATGEE
jgi:TPP-dependent pyruvate/acetoin dehydrogenase alpha subunit